MAQPYNKAHALALSKIAMAMTEYWDPRILDDTQRLNDVTRFFNPRTKPWPAGNDFVHIRVKNKMLRSTRAEGNMSTANTSGFTYNNAPQTLGFTEWQIGQDDLPAYNCNVKYRFKLNEIMGSASIGPIAQQLSEESLRDVNERMEIAILTRQSGALAAVYSTAGMVNELTAFGGTRTATATHARLYLKDGASALFHEGDVIDIVSDQGTFCTGGSVTRTTAESTHWEITNVGHSRAGSAMYGYVDIKPSEAGGASTPLSMAINASHPSTPAYLTLSGEYTYNASYLPNGAPADHATATAYFKNMYGLKDWFRTETSSPGTIYNKNRATAGNQWAVPLVERKTAQTKVALSDVDEMLVQVYQKRLNDPRLTEYVLLCGPRMAVTLTQLTGTANRFLDGAMQQQTKLFTHYGFDGVMIHNPASGSAVAVQGVRGMEEDRLYLVQPGVLNLVEPGGVIWVPWDETGRMWENVLDSNGARTDTYRADRHVSANTLIELPRLNAATLNVKPD